ncbi:MAG TPA: helix-turn-helix domain-containing protein [Polyangium sp.]|nr:helix-turn-helix domain-containing protein [Polyangium sp.]
MSQRDAERIVAAAKKLRGREGAGFPLAQLARPAGMSRATLYRRLATDDALAKEIDEIRKEGVRSAKDEFLRAAILMLSERSLSELTMEAVAERAGLSTATLYRTFADRETLVREVLRTSLPTEPLRNILTADGSMPELLERFVDGLLRRLHERPFILRFLILRTQDDFVELRKFRRDEERLSTALVAFFEKHHHEFCSIAPRQLAASLMGQVLGAFVFWRGHEGFVMPDGKSIVALFLNGAHQRHPERTKT